MSDKLKEGTRVRAIMFGVERTGTVFLHWATARPRPSIIWVKWDGAERLQWVHRESLTVMETPTNA